MKRLALGLAFGALLAAAPLGAAAAAPLDGVSLPGDAVATVLTPDQAGITEPAQGFYPYFTGLGGGPFNGTSFWGNSTVSGIGVTALPPQQGLVGTAGFLGFSGLGGAGFGGSPFAVGAYSPLGAGGCGVFSLGFCPPYTSYPIGSAYGSGFGASGVSPFFGAGIGVAPGPVTIGTGGPIFVYP
jgi:hypothetical protein